MNQEYKEWHGADTGADSHMPKNIKLLAIVAYFIFLLPLLTESKGNPYVKFHVKQGFVLFLSFAVQTIFGIIPVIGMIAAPILLVINLILLIIGIVNAARGKEKRLPLIGVLADRFKF